MSGTAIGIGVVVLLFLVILFFVFSGDDTSNDVVASGEEVPEPDVNDPPCSDFECGEGLEVKQGELGTTSQQCCQKPLCPADICSANNVEFKDPIPGARGNTLEECCEDALCSEDICMRDYKLKPDARLGRTNDDCCIEKPLCPADICDTSTHDPKPGNTKGTTPDECCISKSCQVNGWGDVVVDGDGGESGRGCANIGLSPKENLSRILGYTSDICCQQPLCKNDGSITCPEGKKINDKIRGSDADSCCVPKTCKENGWDEDRFTPSGEGAVEIGISKCKFFSNQTKSRKEDLTNVIGNSVDECCEEKLCSNNYFYDESCPGDDIQVTSSCFKLENIKTGKPLSIGNMKKNCANLGKKLAPDGTLLPVTGNADDTCCVPLTCGELKEKDPTNSKVNCNESSIFNPEGISESVIGSSDSTENPCCSASTCAEAYQGTDKCSDPATYKGAEEYAYSRYGGGDEVNVKVENMKYDITKGPSPAGPGCCVPKTCADLGFNDEKCRSKSNGVKLSDPSKAGNYVVGDGVTSCCREKPCSQKTEEELDQMCGWNMTKKSELPTEGEGTVETCCEFKKCSDIGWDDAKCKDREYTRASVRGKAKKDADGGSISLDDTSETGIETKWKAEYAKTDTGENGKFEGDEYCCEQDLENNFARMCVGNEWRNGVIRNLSPGAIITDGDGHPILPVPGQNYDSYYGKTSEQCMESCKGDDRCTSFTLGANTNHQPPLVPVTRHPAPHTQEKPSCILYQKLGSSVNVNDIISSEWGHRRTAIQYFSAKTFPEKYRYSGGEIEAEGNKFLTCENDEGQPVLCNTQWDNNNLTFKNNSNRPQRHRATTIAWGGGAENAPFKDHTKRKEIYLAGVDREFCPVDFVKHYGTWRLDGETAITGTWHGMGSEVLKMGDNTEGLWKNGSASRSATGNCSDHPNVKVNESLDDCYRNLNCDWSWFTPKHLIENGELKFATQNDPRSSEMYKSPINSSSLEKSRRVCHKKNFNKNSSEPALHMPPGGASVSPTRMIVDGKLKFGVMSDKNPTGWGDHGWKNMIITSIGDSSQAD